MDHLLIPVLGLQVLGHCWLHVSHASAMVRRERRTTMTTKDAATALAKRIEWTKGDIQDDRTELANALAALARTAMEESKAFLVQPDRTPSLALVRGQADLVESYVRSIERKQAVLEALQKVAEWSGS
jgi:hypothetical protein